jgi:hypothetical protein
MCQEVGALNMPARTKDRVCCYRQPKEEGKVNQDLWMLFKKCASISISFPDQHVLESPLVFPIPPILGTRFSKGVGFVTPGNSITIKYSTNMV